MASCASDAHAEAAPNFDENDKVKGEDLAWPGFKVPTPQKDHTIFSEGPMGKKYYADKSACTPCIHLWVL